MAPKIPICANNIQGTTKKQLRLTLWVTGAILLLPAIAYANMGPAIAIQFGLHFMFLTWIIGLGEGLLLCTLFRAWKIRSWRNRIFNSMIAANFTSAWLGMLFVKSRYAAQIMGDVTIENLTPTFWIMVYVTFVLTMIIEFPFFVAALYGRKWLIPKAVAATLLAHGISYTLLFNWYTPESLMNVLAEFEVVPASAFEMKEDYDLYYISTDGKHVLKSDLAGNRTEVVTTLDMDGVPDRLCVYPKMFIEDSPKESNKWNDYYNLRVCWEDGFDLFILMNVKGVYEKQLLIENFSPRAAVSLRDGKCSAENDVETEMDFGIFRSFGDADNWEFDSDYWGLLSMVRIKQGYPSYTDWGYREEKSDVRYNVHTPFVQWSVRNGTHIAGDYAVFKLGKDQICILDPEKKRIALIARGFGPVVAKPSLDKAQSELIEQKKESAQAVEQSTGGGQPVTPKVAEPPTIKTRTFSDIWFVLIPPGDFMMGSPETEEGRNGDEKQHRVVITQGFWLGKYEITREQWRKVMTVSPGQHKYDKDLPVEKVSWDDCQEFIDKLNAVSDGKFRLPTEAEWEYACRAGTSTAYFCGDDSERLDNYSWYEKNSLYGPCEVAKKQPNPWGLRDMTGNVWEWCQDRYDLYSSIIVENPSGPSSGNYRVIRGGSCRDDSSLCRSASRRYKYPDYKSDNLGFRLVRAL